MDHTFEFQTAIQRAPAFMDETPHQRGHSKHAVVALQARGFLALTKEKHQTAAASAGVKSRTRSGVRIVPYSSKDTDQLGPTHPVAMG